MSRDYCECPYCRREFPVTWGWTALKTAYLNDEDGDVVTDSDCLYAARVTYMHHVQCPHCGTRLGVLHELVPRFYAFEEVDHGND